MKLIENRLIVCIANSWDYDPTSKHQIAKILAQQNDIVWVNYHGSRRPTISRVDLAGAASTLRRVARGMQRVSPSFMQVTPMVIPGATHPMLKKLHEVMLVAQIRRAGESDLRLTLGGRGGGRGGGGRDRGGESAAAKNSFEGELSEPSKPSKRLRLKWLKSKAGDEKKGLRTVDLRVDYGKLRLTVPMSFVEASSHKVKSYRGLGFTYPLALFEKRLADGKETVVMSLIPKGKHKAGAIPGFNVVVSEASARVEPMAKKPPQRGRGGRGGGGRRGGGRGDGQSEPEFESLDGTVQWSTSQDAVGETVALTAVKVAKKSLEFEIRAGAKLGVVRVPLPVLPKK